MSMLSMENITAGYVEEIDVLYDVSLEVIEGAITGIIGANGAGKSTILKTIFGFLHPREGKIIFEGRNLLAIEICTSNNLCGSLHIYHAAIQWLTKEDLLRALFMCVIASELFFIWNSPNNINNIYRIPLISDTALIVRPALPEKIKPEAGPRS